jgi:hypothetical protein
MQKKRNHHFDEAHVLHELKHYLPSQTPLKDFIHHNSLHAFQKLKFYEGIFKASKIFGYQVTLQLTEYRELYATAVSGKIFLKAGSLKEKAHHSWKNGKRNCFLQNTIPVIHPGSVH